MQYPVSQLKLTDMYHALQSKGALFYKFEEAHDLTGRGRANTNTVCYVMIKKLKVNVLSINFNLDQLMPLTVVVSLFHVINIY